MSNRRHISSRRRRPNVSHALLEAQARWSADDRGCTCDIEVKVCHLSPGVVYVNIGHDADCPALRAGAA